MYPEPEPEPEPLTEGCTDSNATNFDSVAEVDDGTCVYPEPEPEPEPEPQTGPDPTIDDDQSSSGSGDSQSSGGLTTGQFIRVVLGLLTLIAGAFLITLMIHNGVSSYRAVNVYEESWPNWQEQVSVWRNNSDHLLKIWPRNWLIRLNPSENP